MRTTRQWRGAAAESLAASYLIALGWRIVARNVGLRTRLIASPLSIACDDTAALRRPPNTAAPIAWPTMREKTVVDVAMPRFSQPTDA